MKDTNRYLKTGKWKSDRVYKILTNTIYIGIFSFGKYKRKKQDILLDNQIGIIYKEKINEQKRKELSKKYLIFSMDDLIKNDNPTDKLRNNIISQNLLNIFMMVE